MSQLYTFLVAGGLGLILGVVISLMAGRRRDSFSQRVQRRHRGDW